MIAPEICAPCKYWFTNDYDGLDAAGAIALADVLEAELAAGRTATFAALAHPHEPELVDNFAPEPRYLHPDPHPFVANVAAFAAFLRQSGGFEIW